jgi:hypothetical protein
METVPFNGTVLQAAECKIKIATLSYSRTILTRKTNVSRQLIHAIIHVIGRYFPYSKSGIDFLERAGRNEFKMS